METELACFAVTMNESAITEVDMDNTLRVKSNTSFLRRRRIPAAAPTRGPLIVPLLSKAATFDSCCRVSSVVILCSLTMFQRRASALFCFCSTLLFYWVLTLLSDYVWVLCVCVCVLLVGLCQWMRFCWFTCLRGEWERRRVGFVCIGRIWHGSFHTSCFLILLFSYSIVL